MCGRGRRITSESGGCDSAAKCGGGHECGAALGCLATEYVHLELESFYGEGQSLSEWMLQVCGCAGGGHIQLSPVLSLLSKRCHSWGP